MKTHTTVDLSKAAALHMSESSNQPQTSLLSRARRPLLSCLLSLAILLGLGWVQEAQAATNTCWNEPSAVVRKEIQQNLKTLCFYSGTVNGTWNQATLSAIQKVVAKWAGYKGSTNGLLVNSGGELCKAVQTFARGYGSYTGPIDGLMGLLTWPGFNNGLKRQIQIQGASGCVLQPIPKGQILLQQGMDFPEENMDSLKEDLPTENKAEEAKGPEADTPNNTALSEDNAGHSSGCSAVGGPFSLAALLSLAALRLGRRRST